MERITYTSEEEWLKLRRNGIGGSDAAILAGLNPYSSPYMLWLDKLDKLGEPDEPNEAMIQGKELEEYVAERFTRKTGKKVHKVNAILRNPDYPFAQASVDRKVEGENAYLECKTISPLYWNKFEDEEFPSYYYIQCLHYMMVTGAEKMYLTILPFQNEPEIFEIERDEEAIKNLAEIEKDFWENHVLTGEPPEVDGTKATDEALKIQYQNADEDLEVVRFFNMDSKLKELVRLKETRKELNDQIRKIEQEFKEQLGEATRGETESFRVTWKPEIRKTFNSKAFIKDHPDIDYTDYYNKKPNRVFRYKEI